MANVYLTKSRFKVGADCATKLYYLDRPEFGNANKENAFLQALAEGGFQVGELAKLYFDGGTEITTLDKEQAVRETLNLIAQENVIIYEAAIKYENLFIRADILIKEGNSIRIVEVKAKSFDSRDQDQFFTKASLKKGPKKIASTWQPYLLDIAFQCFVAQKAFPDNTVSGALMLADKSACATVDGLNQRFYLTQDLDGRTRAKVRPGTEKNELGRSILTCVDVDEAMEILRTSSFECGGKIHNFDELVAFLATTCEEGLFISPVLSSGCKTCEFRISHELKQSKKSGFERCWSEAVQLKPKDFKRPFVFDVWNFRKSPQLIEAGTYFMDQIQKEDINPTSGSEVAGLSNSERQWVQVEKVIANDSSTYLDAEGIARESKSWVYPLHFIDFETTMVAIPFHAGRRPYEQIAFQFSHHRVDENGTILHVDQFLHREKGKFPNFEFVRALKKSLSTDQGTIFRYATHENTVLCQIKEQLLTSLDAPTDRDQLVAFIDSITTYTDASGTKVVGERCMVDLCELVKRYFYAPEMNGSNSIKKVLPAILNTSSFLQLKYGQSIYGSDHGIASLNFKDWKWMEKGVDGKVIDPYKRLPPVFSDLELSEMDDLITDSTLADGGAAMTAYARMQFTEMTEKECDLVSNALLKYCELDTLAMVLIWEHWNEEVKRFRQKAA